MIKIIFIGMSGPFSLIPFHTLVDAGHKPVGIVAPAIFKGSGIPSFSDPVPVDKGIWLIAPHPPLTRAANNLLIPAMMTDDLHHPRALKWLEQLEPDLFVTACFPHILPSRWLQIPRLGALNLHPSLLPAYRGPYPLFWQFRSGETQTGVTVHWMSKRPDTGDIAAQVHVPLPDGLSGAEADERLAREGANAVVRLLENPENIPHIPQSRENASYQPVPSQDDFTIPTTWTARRAYNFLRGANEWKRFKIIGEKETYAARDADTFTMDNTRPLGDNWVRFIDGWVKIRPANHPTA